MCSRKIILDSSSSVTACHYWDICSRSLFSHSCIHHCSSCQSVHPLTDPSIYPFIHSCVRSSTHNSPITSTHPLFQNLLCAYCLQETMMGAEKTVSSLSSRSALFQEKKTMYKEQVEENCFRCFVETSVPYNRRSGRSTQEWMPRNG